MNIFQPDMFSDTHKQKRCPNITTKLNKYFIQGSVDEEVLHEILHSFVSGCHL